MAGTALAAGVLAVTASLVVGVAAVGAAAVTAQRAAGAADAAALAAADVASGAIESAEEPCDVAARVAATVGGVVELCRLDGLFSTVRVSIPYAGLGAGAIARAGPVKNP